MTSPAPTTIDRYVRAPGIDLPEARRLRAKGWSALGLARRYRVPVEAVLAALGLQGSRNGWDDLPVSPLHEGVRAPRAWGAQERVREALDAGLNGDALIARLCRCSESFVRLVKAGTGDRS